MVRIKVTLPDLPETDGSLRGSSPVRGNAYAGFLGGLGLATAPGYPTQVGRHETAIAKKSTHRIPAVTCQYESHLTSWTIGIYDLAIASFIGTYG
jgi:hypothetical protein